MCFEGPWMKLPQLVLIINDNLKGQIKFDWRIWHEFEVFVYECYKINY